MTIEVFFVVHGYLPDQLSNLGRQFQDFARKSWEIVGVQQWSFIERRLSVRGVLARVLIGGDYASPRVGRGSASFSMLAGANVYTGRCIPKDSRNSSGREEVENILFFQLEVVVGRWESRVDVVEQC
jgi:hypothetical protein